MPRISPLVAGDPTHLGSFRLSGRVGEGGQGIVYLGVNDEGERAAIKLLHVKFSGDTIARSRFARELKAAQRVASFCTARVIEADLDGDTPYIASEYIEGKALRDLVDSDGPLTGTTLDRLAIGTATALTAIHHASIIHRDFKPDNVLIAADGPRVVDFGIARIIDSTGTITSRAIGTPAYMAPEQIAGDDIGPYTDVFSWGATMAFAATGETVFEGKSIAVVLNRILNHEVDVSMMAEPLRSVVSSALAKSPAERPSADQILLRLLGQSSTAGASTAVLTKGVQLAGDDTTPFIRVSAGSITDHPSLRALVMPSRHGTSEGTGRQPGTGWSTTGPGATGTEAPAGAEPEAGTVTGPENPGSGAGTGSGAATGTGTGAGAGTGTGLGRAATSLRDVTGPQAGSQGATGQTGSQGATGQQTGPQGAMGLPTAPPEESGPPPGEAGPPTGGAEGGGAPYPAKKSKRRRRARVLAAAAATLAAVTAAAVLATANGWLTLPFGGTPGPTAEPTRPSVVDKVAATGRIVIGVRGDLPGVGLRNGDGFEGFDVDVARQLATELGAKETKFVQVSRGDRAEALEKGKVDLVVAAYSVDKGKTQFAGPYYVAHRDLLVRADSGLDKIGDLKGKKVCAPSGSLGEVQEKVTVEPVPVSDYAACMDLLRSGKIAAVPGEDVVLAGFAQRESLRYKILGAKLNNERYAVGIRNGDLKTCKAIKAVIADLYARGVIERLLTSRFGRVDFEMELKVPAMETC
ncbi:transporter substrate-binding domain-containing protein [Nonomuraea mesophila]|uniref:Transporter substrate-binding domain-containing protein n=1 Tax=Nonomuraea mesophila TaxID=2530382 RepID=A0A4R5FXA5_9ACTN|nr:serine/threonine-protein kinase [Nonomuraea mesophila]TDE59886.1 transporter substrate-binding domain-containing protein [Nonomuraea mesophila]